MSREQAETRAGREPAGTSPGDPAPAQVPRGHGHPDHDLTVVAATAHEVRLRTRLRVEIGRLVSCAIDTPGARRVITGRVQRNIVVGIDADGLTFEVTMSLEAPCPPLPDGAAARLLGRGATGTGAPPTLSFVAADIDEGPDLEAFLGTAEG